MGATPSSVQMVLTRAATGNSAGSVSTCRGRSNSRSWLCRISGPAKWPVRAQALGEQVRVRVEKDPAQIVDSGLDRRAIALAQRRARDDRADTIARQRRDGQRAADGGLARARRPHHHDGHAVIVRESVQNRRFRR
jgi:hypothetical protein